MVNTEKRSITAVLFDVSKVIPLVYELLVDSFAHESENDMESLITSIYGEEYYQELVKSVTPEEVSQ